MHITTTRTIEGILASKIAQTILDQIPDKFLPVEIKQTGTEKLSGLREVGPGFCVNSDWEEKTYTVLFQEDSAVEEKEKYGVAVVAVDYRNHLIDRDYQGFDTVSILDCGVFWQPKSKSGIPAQLLVMKRQG